MDEIVTYWDSLQLYIGLSRPVTASAGVVHPPLPKRERVGDVAEPGHHDAGLQSVAR